jgi:hypothetical protein
VGIPGSGIQALAQLIVGNANDILRVGSPVADAVNVDDTLVLVSLDGWQQLATLPDPKLAIISL